eukprot:TRINITY_DN1718_c0_g1_i1.p1 TRINITY_DN1718_c0_g1~~TRINITY_DN1718_c0_g1_i1.p1  ORF type:complete len:163 (+),score=15.24 TRINITY_DN1718_c0_g1_i1:59-490(+)
MAGVRACLFVLAVLPQVFGRFFGRPKYIDDACKKWCVDATTSNSTDLSDACKFCHSGPQISPACTGGNVCSYCDREIVFPRHYPKLWRSEPTFNGKFANLEGRSRCWCETGCPVYKTKSWLFCHSTCSSICNHVTSSEDAITV